VDKLTMSVKELAAALGCSLPKAYELTERAGFPCLHLGRRKVVPVEGFRLWLAAQTSAQGAAGRVGVL